MGNWGGGSSDPPDPPPPLATGLYALYTMSAFLTTNSRTHALVWIPQDVARGTRTHAGRGTAACGTRFYSAWEARHEIYSVCEPRHAILLSMITAARDFSHAARGTRHEMILMGHHNFGLEALNELANYITECEPACVNMDLTDDTMCCCYMLCLGRSTCRPVRQWTDGESPNWPI